jgi:hypothetical protein
MEDPKHAAWLAAFDNDFYYKQSARYLTVLSRRIAYTTLYWAGTRQWEKVLTTLRLGCCDANDRVYFPEHGFQPSLLHVVTYNGDLYAMQTLVHEFGARLDVLDDYKCTVLMYAVYGRKLNAVQWLLQQPDIDLHAVSDTTNCTAHAEATINKYYDIADCIAAEIAARARWSSPRAAWLAVCVNM